jgi:hypothetical protein
VRLAVARWNYGDCEAATVTGLRVGRWPLRQFLFALKCLNAALNGCEARHEIFENFPNDQNKSLGLTKLKHYVGFNALVEDFLVLF